MLADDQLRDYAAELMLDHARRVEFLTIHEAAEELPDGVITDEDAETVDKLIGTATITISWPDNDTEYTSDNDFGDGDDA